MHRIAHQLSDFLFVRRNRRHFLIVPQIHYADAPLVADLQHAVNHFLVFRAVKMRSGVEEYRAAPGFLHIGNDGFHRAGDGRIVENKRKAIDAIFDPAIEEGIQDFFIYCNSLSGAFDFETYAAEKGVRVYTPLQVYRELARKYNRVGVVAAHNLSAYKIEETFMQVNPDVYVIGSGNMDIVSSIERGYTPREIIERCGIEHMVKYMEACRCEALVLGCTHFPYLREELDKFCNIPVIDPADEMFSAMTGLK